MLAIKKRPLSAEPLYFDFTKRLSPGETLVSCDADVTMILPSSTNTDLTFGALGVNTGGPLYPPNASPIGQSMGVSTIVQGGVLPSDSTQLSALLPDGTIGTLYEFSFSVTTSLVIDAVSRVINEQYQLWVSNDDYPAYWTSRWELNRRYGKSAVDVWADPDNEQVTTDVSKNIWAAVAEATDEFRNRLRGGAQGPITPTIAAQSFQLRLNCTKLAAYYLYTARGVKDTSSEAGVSRLTTARSEADTFIKRCRAGQIRLVDGDTGVTMYPMAFPERKPLTSPYGRGLTPEETLRANERSELQGIPSYNWWFDGFSNQFGP